MYPGEHESAAGPQASEGAPKVELRRVLGRNPGLLCGFRALQMTLFPIAIITLFWTYQIGMSMAEILFLQGIFGLAMAAFEFPSGYLADRIGYRRTLIAASLLMAVGWSVYVVADSLAVIAAAEVVLGVAMSLLSGADSALLYESLVESGREGEFARWDGRVRFFGQTAEGTAALVAGVLYAISPRVPFALQVAVWLVAAAVAAAMVEPARHPPPAGGHWQQIRYMLRHVLRDSRPLAAVVAVSVALGLASFVPVWLVPLYAEAAGVPVAWLGPLWAMANYSVAIAALASEPLRRRLGLVPLLLGCVGLVGVGYAGLGLVHAVWGVAFYFCLTAMRGVHGPALLHAEHRLIPSSDRAGFLSLRSTLFRVVFFALAPVVGAAVDDRGQHPVLLALGAGLVAAALLACAALAVTSRRAPVTRAGDTR